MKNWTPYPKQEEFLSIPDSVFEALYGGAAGGGKTETLLVLPLVKQSIEDRPLFDYPRFKALYLRRTFRELDNEVIPRSKEFYPDPIFRYNDTKKRYTHISGSILQFGHCEHEKDVTNYDSAEYNIIIFDEVTTFTAYMYEYLTFSRCRTSDPNLPHFVRSGTNPGNIGHAYHYKRFVQPAKDGGVILRESRKVHGIDTVLTRIFIPSKVSDNPSIIQNDPTYVARLNSLPPAERAAKLDGNWEIFSGQVFSDFRVTPLPSEPANACHICDPFTIPDYWPKVLSIDWGYSALTVGLWFAINPNPSDLHPGKIYIYREYAERRKLISEWASDISRLSQNEKLIDIVMDPSAWQNRGDELNISEQFEQFSALMPRKADNDRVSGKLLIQEHLRWQTKPPRYIPPQGFDMDVYWKIHRFKGAAASEEYRALFEPEPEEKFLPKLLIFNTCIGLIDNIPKCIYKVESGRKSEDNPEGNAEEVAELKNDVDDFYDDLRYGIKACQSYLDSGLFQHQREAQIAKVFNNFQRHKDLTQFNIEMDNLEALKPIQKYKRFQGRGKRLRFSNF